MRTAGRWLLVGWLLAALVLLGMEGRLPEFLVGAASASLLALGLWSLVRQQLAPSRYNRPALPNGTGWPTTFASRSPPSSQWPKRKPRPDGSRCRWLRPRLPS